MSVDEKYVENVNEVVSKETEKMMAEMGISASYKPVSDNGIDLRGYDVKTLRNMPVGDSFYGKPILGKPVTNEFKDEYTGETKTRHSVDFVLIDEDENEAYMFKVNLPDAVETFENVQYGGLYNFVCGLMELEVEGISQYYNCFDKIDLKLLRKKIAKYETLEVRVVQSSFTNKQQEEVTYKDFRITGGDLN